MIVISTYKEYVIRHNPKPIASSSVDFDWHHKDFDLDDWRCGYCSSVEEAKDMIDELIYREEIG